MIKKIVVKNYKLLKDVTIGFNPLINILAGENDAGKSTILEVLAILTTGRLSGVAFERQIKANLFNLDIRNEYNKEVKEGHNPSPPVIVLEAYFDGDSSLKGTNNLLGENAVGINVTVEMDVINSEIYKRMLIEEEVKDIPIELYSVSFHYFNGSIISYKYPPFKSILIDTTRKEYSGLVDHFVSDSISDYLTDQQKTDLAVAYLSSRRGFNENEVVQKLNEIVKENASIKGRDVSLDLRETEADAWRKQMSVVVNGIPFENIGFGSQNAIKIELAMRNAEEQANIVLLEEPENNLSFSNMNFLIKNVIASNNKQVFISTHSSFIANKLDLSNVILLHKGCVKSYSELPENTKKYFSKLPGYDTLRFVLASKVVLVEGPTDDLIIQRAYRDAYGHLPSDDGIDIIAVGSLAFKHFCDIANLTNQRVIVVTDNDGDVENNIIRKYSDYLGRDNLVFIYEQDNNLKTIEPSVLSVNCVDGEPTEVFKRVISKNGSLLHRDYKGLLSFMQENKTEWAFRVFDSEERIVYPKYVIDVVKSFE